MYSAGDMYIDVQHAEDHKYPGQHHEYDAGKMRDIFENGENVEQDRHFELVGESVGELHRALRPLRLAERDIFRPHCTTGKVARAQRRHAAQQHEGENHLDE
jgi:hypothetical protein